MYDVIIAGARCAGSPLAMLLARQGLRVLLVDRSDLPSDTMNGHVIKPGGVARLQSWGLLEQVLTSGAPPVRRRRVRLGDVTLAGELPAGSPPLLAPRRFVLDAILLEAAAAAGAEVRTRTALTGLERDADGRATGVRLRGRSAEHCVTARLVVGADGRHSTVARLAGAEYTHFTPPVTAAYWAYWSGARPDAQAIRYRAGVMNGVFPTNGGEFLAFVAVPRAEAPRFAREIETEYLRELMGFADLADAFAGARMTSPVRGAVDLPNFFRAAAGPGWALAGDAAHHKDPLAARGITDAFGDAALLADAVVATIGAGPAALDAALRRCAQRREETALEVYGLNLALASADHSDLHLTAELARRLAEAEARADGAAARNLAAAG